MIVKPTVLVISLALVIAGLLQEAAAQQASSFEQLQVLVKIGDTVSLTDSSGQISKGRIAALTPSSLRFQTNGIFRDFAQSDIMEIRQRKGDSLKNGAKIGALVGLGVGILGAIGLCTDDFEVDPCAAWAAGAIGFYTGTGAAIGVGIDALIVRDQTIYRPGTQPTSSRFNRMPLRAIGASD
jgi:hypothetical protein